jgi:hypothetical protein
MQFLKLGRLVLCVSLSTIGYAATEPFIRGDSDVDGVVTLNDAVFTLNYLFQGGSAPTCEDAADVNDDGQIGIDDPVYTLLFLFQGGIVPPSPFPCEDQDFTADRLECDAYNIPEGHLHIRGLRSPPLLLSPGLGDTVLRERLILSQDTLFTEARVYFRTAETPEQAISDASALIDVRLKIDDEIVGDTGVLIDAGVLGLIDPFASIFSMIYSHSFLRRDFTTSKSLSTFLKERVLRSFNFRFVDKGSQLCMVIRRILFH